MSGSPDLNPFVWAACLMIVLSNASGPSKMPPCKISARPSLMSSTAFAADAFGTTTSSTSPRSIRQSLLFPYPESRSNEQWFDNSPRPALIPPVCHCSWNRLQTLAPRQKVVHIFKFRLVDSCQIPFIVLGDAGLLVQFLSKRETSGSLFPRQKEVAKTPAGNAAVPLLLLLQTHAAKPMRRPVRAKH